MTKEFVPMSSLLDSLNNSSTVSTPSPNSTVIYDQTNLTYAQVVVSLVTALAQLILIFLQLVIRSTWRHRRLVKMQRQNRFYGAQLLAQPHKSRRRRIVEEGLEVHKFKIVSPEQYNRAISVVVADSRDSRQDCSEMLKLVRAALRKTHGGSANLMSMRTCLSCLSGVLPREQTEIFLHTYDSVVFGQHRVNSTSDILSSSDIRLMYAFFHNTVMKELQ